MYKTKYMVVLNNLAIYSLTKEKPADALYAPNEYPILSWYYLARFLASTLIDGELCKSGCTSRATTSDLIYF